MRSTLHHLPTLLPAGVMALALVFTLLLGGCGGGDEAELDSSPAHDPRVLVLQQPAASAPAGR